MTKRTTALGGAALSLVALALVHLHGSGPSLYDGVCTPPPYKVLGSVPPPPSASQTFSAADLAQIQALADDPMYPQAQLIMTGGTLTPAPGRSTVTLTITPVKPPEPPSGRVIATNVYDFAATSGGMAVQPTARHEVTIDLNQPGWTGSDLTLERYDGTHWTTLATVHGASCENPYDATSQSLGLFALIGPAGSTTGLNAGTVALIVFLCVAALLSSVVAVLRQRRRAGTGARSFRGPT